MEHNVLSFKGAVSLGVYETPAKEEWLDGLRDEIGKMRAKEMADIISWFATR